MQVNVTVDPKVVFTEAGPVIITARKTFNDCHSTESKLEHYLVGQLWRKSAETLPPAKAGPHCSQNIK